MNKPSFCIGKDQSLVIMRDVLSHLTEDGQIMLNEKMNWRDRYGSSSSSRAIAQRHKIAVVEVEMSLPDYEDSKLSPETKEAFDLAVQNGDFNRSESIEIHHGSEIVDDKIMLTAYLHGTQSECDVSYPCFTYDSTYQCWIIRDAFWGAAGGIDCNGIVTVLDFSAYEQGQHSE